MRKLMKCPVRYFGFVLLALIISITATPGFALAQKEHKGSSGNHPKDEHPNPEPRLDEAVPGRVIVKYKEDAGPAARSDARRGEGLEKKKDLELIGAEVDEVKGRTVEQAIRGLESRPDVEYAEPDYIVRSSGYADEPRFAELWGLNNTGQAVGSLPAGTEDVDVNAVEAAAVTRGDPNLTVAVIDDGVDFSHPDLAGREWTNPGESGGGKETNGLDDDGNGYVDDVNGWDFHNGDNSVYDAGDHHGTHISGTIAASVNGEGIVGVAPNVKIMALKFLESGDGSTSDAIHAIEYAKSKGAKISNNSWGGGDYNQALKDAIEASGMLFVASAGNDGLDTDIAPHYPSSYISPNILSVAAIDNQGELSGFSNYGAGSVDLSAPGVNILGSVPGASWEFLHGTSVATPHATGVAALAASDSPDLRSDPVALKMVLLESGKPVPATVGKTVTGKMVDARAAIAPRVIAESPVPGASKAGRNVDVKVAFSKGMQRSSLSSNTVTLRRSSSSTPVLAKVSYDAYTRTVTLDPNRKLRRGDIYVATIKGGSRGARDLAGNLMQADESWSFTVRR